MRDEKNEEAAFPERAPIEPFLEAEELIGPYHPLVTSIDVPTDPLDKTKLRRMVKQINNAVEAAERLSRDDRQQIEGILREVLDLLHEGHSMGKKVDQSFGELLSLYHNFLKEPSPLNQKVVLDFLDRLQSNLKNRKSS